jgi:membrane protease subunit (stomatin/prohibitin family)
MASLLTAGKFQAINADGPVPGALLYTYAAGSGTATPLDTYTDQGGGSANTNPVVCDASGQASVWLGSSAYHLVLKDSAGLTIWDEDNITGFNSLAGSSGSASVGFIQAGTGAVARTAQAKMRELISSADFNDTRGTNNLGFGTRAVDATTTAVQNIGIGTDALTACTTGFANTAVGHNALKTLTTPAYCTAVGGYALENANLTANVNLLCTAVGAYALNANTDGQYNTAVGAYAGQKNTTGYFNTYVGQNSGVENLTGVSNVAIGHSALQLNLGSRNVAIGDNALPIATGAADTVAIGYQALAVNLTGDQSIAIGTNALATATVGPNVAIGYLAAQSIATGVDNVAIGPSGVMGSAIFGASRNIGIGTNALNALTSNTDNTAVGDKALDVSTAVGNTALGASAGGSNTSGGNNIFIGKDAGTDAVATVTTASNAIVLGNNSHTNAYIKIAWTVTSDARDKTDVFPLDRGLDFVMNLRPKSFKLKDRETGQATTGTRYGLMAQEVNDTTLVDSGDPDNLKLRESMLIPVLIKAIQELKAEVEALRGH